VSAEPARRAGRRRAPEPDDFVDEVEERLAEIERRLERIDENVQAFCYTLGAQIDMQVETAELLGRLLGRLTGRIEELEALLGPPAPPTSEG
jgi:tetrahydromethanopterin S-methyltransferase subunit G